MARERLQPTYPRAINEENPSSSSAIEVEMMDLHSTGETTSIDTDVDMLDCGDDNINDGHPQHVLEDSPGLITHPKNTQVSVIFDSDADDSDDDGNQDQVPRLETGPPPSPRTTSGADTECAPPASEFV